MQNNQFGGVEQQNPSHNDN